MRGLLGDGDGYGMYYMWSKQTEINITLAKTVRTSVASTLYVASWQDDASVFAGVCGCYSVLQLYYLQCKNIQQDLEAFSDCVCLRTRLH